MKRKIFITSFLKPINDIRSYEKIAKSLASNSSYKIYCLGYPSNIQVSDNKIILLSLGFFKKNGFGRIIARFKVFRYYIKVKPELIIVNSPDLLLFTSLYRILFGGQIIYDIRENYFKNLWYQKNYKWRINYFFAIMVRIKEWLTAPLFSHFILAEKIYAKQIFFIKNRYTIIENKCILPKKVRVKDTKYENLKFLISGTISKEFGVLEGINFYKLVQKKYCKAKLIIIGHCPNNSLYQKLHLIQKNMPSIKLHISNCPIPHCKIESEILQSDFGLLPYLPNKSINGKWPTKLYEYSAYKLPFIIQQNKEWNKFVTKKTVGITTNFLELKENNAEKLLQSHQLMIAKHKNCTTPDIYWVSEEKKLIQLIGTFL